MNESLLTGHLIIEIFDVEAAKLAQTDGVQSNCDTGESLQSSIRNIVLCSPNAPITEHPILWFYT